MVLDLRRQLFKWVLGSIQVQSPLLSLHQPSSRVNGFETAALSNGLVFSSEQNYLGDCSQDSSIMLVFYLHGLVSKGPLTPMETHKYTGLIAVLILIISHSSPQSLSPWGPWSREERTCCMHCSLFLNSEGCILCSLCQKNPYHYSGPDCTGWF